MTAEIPRRAARARGRIDRPRRYSGRYESAADQPYGLTLHVDIDGPQPLHVVSGQIRAALGGVRLEGSFVGRVASRTSLRNGCELVVDGFELPHAGRGATVRSLHVRLHARGPSAPTAAVLLMDARGQAAGDPLLATRTAPFFREVAIDVDREWGTKRLPTYDTWAHPDRPKDLRQRRLTLASAFEDAGIRIRLTEDDPAPVDIDEAGADHRWSYSELHDSMALHWEEYASAPQWKMWLFLAREAESPLAGVMFDADIDEPGGVDRQGAAVFTQFGYYHSPSSGYARRNPPADAAARRELFYNVVHELGHAFNLTHPFELAAEMRWSRPSWFVDTRGPLSFTWMNYPTRVNTDWTGLDTSWFYRRFRFRFHDAELLFLRHADGSNVQPGGASWAQNHGREADGAVATQQRLELRARKRRYEFGEPVLLELRLRNRSRQPLRVHDALEASDGLVEIAITDPSGERRPFVPFDRTRRPDGYRELAPGEAIYTTLDLTIGKLGFPFKQPGRYVVHARHISGARARLALELRAPASRAHAAAIQQLFDARVGRVLYVDGTRVLHDVNDKLSWIRRKLGPEHPASVHIAAVQFRSLGRGGQVVLGAQRGVKTLAADPDRAIPLLECVLTRHANAAADTLGHIYYNELVHEFAAVTRQAGSTARARAALEQLLGVFEARRVLPQVVARAQKRFAELQPRGRRRR